MTRRNQADGDSLRDARPEVISNRAGCCPTLAINYSGRKGVLFSSSRTGRTR
jgi:hypothetical protein